MSTEKIAKIWHAAALALSGHPACRGCAETTVRSFFALACIHEAAGGDCTDPGELVELYETACDTWLPQPWPFADAPVFGSAPHPSLGASARLLSRTDPVVMSPSTRLGAVRILFQYPLFERAGFLWAPTKSAGTVADLVFGSALRFVEPGGSLLLASGGVPLYVAKALQHGTGAVLVVEATPDTAVAARFVAGYHHDRVCRVALGDPSTDFDPREHGFHTGFSSAFAVVPGGDETDPAAFVRRCLTVVRPGGLAIFELDPWCWIPAEMAELDSVARVEAVVDLAHGSNFLVAMRRLESEEATDRKAPVTVVADLSDGSRVGWTDLPKYAAKIHDAGNARASFDIASHVLKGTAG